MFIEGHQPLSLNFYYIFFLLNIYSKSVLKDITVCQPYTNNTKGKYQSQYCTSKSA